MRHTRTSAVNQIHINCFILQGGRADNPPPCFHPRKEDVPRKMLLLLYIITENVLNDDYISLEQRVKDHWWTLNAILTE